LLVVTLLVTLTLLPTVKTLETVRLVKAVLDTERLAAVRVETCIVLVVIPGMTLSVLRPVPGLWKAVIDDR
jgi:hypothetical protein